MCTELLLAIIYFSTIFAVNYFLYKLLTNYFKNISYLLKIKNIFTSFQLQENTIFSILYLYSKNPLKNKNLLVRLSQFFETKDILIIGNIYHFLLNEKEKPERTRTSTNFYLQLLENQLLSKKFI